MEHLCLPMWKYVPHHRRSIHSTHVGVSKNGIPVKFDRRSWCCFPHSTRSFLGRPWYIEDSIFEVSHIPWGIPKSHLFMLLHPLKNPVRSIPQGDMASSALPGKKRVVVRPGTRNHPAFQRGRYPPGSANCYRMSVQCLGSADPCRLPAPCGPPGWFLAIQNRVPLKWMDTDNTC